MDIQLPTERITVYEDAIHNSCAFVYLILVFTTNFFTLFLFIKTGLIFMFQKIFLNLGFLHKPFNSFSNNFPISFLKHNRDPGTIRFNCSKVYSAWKRGWKINKKKKKCFSNIFLLEIGRKKQQQTFGTGKTGESDLIL